MHRLNLRNCYYWEREFLPSPDEGLRWAMKSVEKKNKFGYYVMGIAYLNGLGVDRNEQKAIEYQVLKR